VVGYIPHGEEEDEYEMWHVIHDDGAQQKLAWRLVPF